MRVHKRMSCTDADTVTRFHFSNEKSKVNMMLLTLPESVAVCTALYIQSSILISDSKVIRAKPKANIFIYEL